ncbi:HAMP domain-containing protein [bacterium]|nr:HAMP domain-containing protein [bacterium]
MFRLRSIRRKLFWSGALVMAMLGLQAFGGLSGLVSYRSVIRDLDHEFSQTPRLHDVLFAISSAQEPLGWQEIDTSQARQFRQLETQKRIQDLQAIVGQYQLRISGETLPPDRRLLLDTLLFQVNESLTKIQHDVLPRLGDPGTSLQATSQLQGELAKIQNTIIKLPRSRQGLESRLDEARAIYKSRFWWIVLSTAAALALFISVVNCGYRWIFAPIRELHQGASRVAQGDFTYRMQIRGDDEMAQLADKFNQMTARFEEIRDQLDKEVRERTKQALRSERLAGVGFLSAGVAHEINNPLSAIAMAAESLEYRIQEAQGQGGIQSDDLGVLAQYLSMIQRESFRCQQITQRLLDFSRGHDAPKTSQDLTRIVGEVLDMVSHMSRFRGYEIVFDRNTPIYATVNGSEIKQVVLNLVANALESMTETGRLEIRVAEFADEVVLTFTDNGCGMTPHVLENLFEPFFTAKPSGRGTGLGLSIVHRIVTDHGGRIVPRSAGAGLGSTFEVHLPRRAAMSSAA